MHWPSLDFKPRLLTSLNGYTRDRFTRDVGAGLTVGVVALPLAMAFAIASGLKPEAGIFTAIIAGLLISLLGGSPVQIGGPAGAFIVIVYGIVERFGLANLIIATAMSGVLLFLMGLFKLGTLIRFIPIAVVIGFTNGIAVLIALSQVKDFLGLQVTSMPADFFGMLSTLGSALHTFNPAAFAVALASLAIIVIWQFFMPKIGSGIQFTGKLTPIPGSIVALVLATLAVWLLNLKVDTIGSRFGGIPAGLPSFAWPAFSWESAKFLLIPTVTLALLGAIESLLCARVADGMIDDRHNPNQELMAQGIANFVTPFFGGMPATGTIARTVTNIKSGATSPVAGMVHAATLLVVILVAAPLASHIPLACAGRDPDVRGLEHGRVARIRAPAPLPHALPHHPAGGVLPDGRVRPDSRRRGRPDRSLRHLHLPHLQPFAQRGGDRRRSAGPGRPGGQGPGPPPVRCALLRRGQAG
jgi:SulP family sulfate permease